LFEWDPGNAQGIYGNSYGKEKYGLFGDQHRTAQHSTAQNSFDKASDPAKCEAGTRPADLELTVIEFTGWHYTIALWAIV
jgi:hypothetical protein